MTAHKLKSGMSARQCMRTAAWCSRPADYRRLPIIPNPIILRMRTNVGACARAVYEDASLVFPDRPTLNTGGCPYRGLTYRPGYMRSLNPSIECAPACPTTQDLCHGWAKRWRIPVSKFEIDYLVVDASQCHLLAGPGHSLCFVYHTYKWQPGSLMRCVVLGRSYFSYYNASLTFQVLSAPFP